MRKSSAVRCRVSDCVVWNLDCIRESMFAPHSDTTRPMRQGEVAGREYLFVSRDKMETDIAAGKFIESGEYKGHLYGTSTESVRSIVNAGCVCVLAPHYQAIKALRTPQLKPYVVHVKPPATFEQLKATRSAARARSTFDEANARAFSVSEMAKTRFLEGATKVILKQML